MARHTVSHEDKRISAFSHQEGPTAPAGRRPRLPSGAFPRRTYIFLIFSGSRDSCPVAQHGARSFRAVEYLGSEKELPGPRPLSSIMSPRPCDATRRLPRLILMMIDLALETLLRLRHGCSLPQTCAGCRGVALGGGSHLLWKKGSGNSGSRVEITASFSFYTPTKHGTDAFQGRSFPTVRVGLCCGRK